MSVKVVVHTIFAAITILQEMDFCRQRYDKEEGRVEWGNRIGDRAEIIVDRQLNCCKIDIYSGSYGLPINNKGGKIKMNGKANNNPTSPPIPLTEYDKAWKEAEQAWKDSAFNPQPIEEEEQPAEDEKGSN